MNNEIDCIVPLFIGEELYLRVVDYLNQLQAGLVTFVIGYEDFGNLHGWWIEATCDHPVEPYIGFCIDADKETFDQYDLTPQDVISYASILLENHKAYYNKVKALYLLANEVVC